LKAVTKPVFDSVFTVKRYGILLGINIYRCQHR
jgi:hypothetical protein